MRAVAALCVALVLLVTTLPSGEAHPFPKTEKALRELGHDTLTDVDASSAKMLRLAHKVIREAKKTVGDVGVPGAPPLPGAPLPDTTQGALEVRASLVQPGIRGQDEMLATMWLGASAGHWTGAYWVESDVGGSTFPNFADLDEMGVLLFLDGGGLATGDSLHVTYHFLGVDGKYVRHALDEIPLLPALPVLDRVDIGGAHGSARGEDPEAILITPWNLFDHNVTMGMTLLRDEIVLDDITINGCADIEATQTEPGCRLLYVLPFSESLTSISLWHVDYDGARVIDRELSRFEILAGTTFTL